ncbi:hypothetical protein SESBI_29459 [Sesbania bispinosa]|nr:hypothetical protein SESBI_29459 [Sesbania bispinosa]
MELTGEEKGQLDRSTKKAKTSISQGTIVPDSQEEELQEKNSVKPKELFPTTIREAVKRKMVSFRDACIGINGVANSYSSSEWEDSDEEEYTDESGGDGEDGEGEGSDMEKSQRSVEEDFLCPTIKQNTTIPQVGAEEVALQNRTAATDTGQTEGVDPPGGPDGDSKFFGAWMIAKRRSRKYQQNNRKGESESGRGFGDKLVKGGFQNNRFGVLNTETQEPISENEPSKSLNAPTADVPPCSLSKIFPKVPPQIGRRMFIWTKQRLPVKALPVSLRPNTR